MELYGCSVKTETVMGREVVIICPPEGTANGRWALKTEYLPAFPEVQDELVSRGYHLVHMKNRSRWNPPEDTDARGELAQLLHEKYGLARKCVPIGMSCGGLQAILFGAKYPQYVSCMYLDAPVVNFLSCPAGLGRGADGRAAMDEFTAARGLTISDLLTYREHPQDKIPQLLEANIPIFLACGDNDHSCPYEENGKLINDYYEAHGGIIQTVIKKGGGHHPHNLPDNTPIIDFILKYDKD